MEAQFHVQLIVKAFERPKLFLWPLDGPLEKLKIIVGEALRKP